MSNAQSIALSGLKVESLHINMLAQDLANLNTPNYKSTELTFSDVLHQNAQGDTLQSTVQTGLGATVSQSGKNFIQGPLMPSEQWNHLAISGDGFFQVEGPDNQLLYTRNSRLTLDTEHYLATEDGLRLSDHIQIPEDALQIHIRKNGDVEVLLSDQTTLHLAGSIQLTTFANANALNPIGAGLYQSTEISGEPAVNNPGSGRAGELLQYQIEGSSVDMLNTLMQLTMAQRIYQLNAKAMQIADEMEKITHEIRS